MEGLAERFDRNICTLGYITTVKFAEFVENMEGK